MIDPSRMQAWEREDFEADQHRKHVDEINRERFTEKSPCKSLEHDVKSPKSIWSKIWGWLSW